MTVSILCGREWICFHMLTALLHVELTSSHFSIQAVSLENPNRVHVSQKSGNAGWKLSCTLLGALCLYTQSFLYLFSFDCLLHSRCIRFFLPNKWIGFEWCIMHNWRHLYVSCLRKYKLSRFLLFIIYLDRLIVVKTHDSEGGDV